jgi:hypothetical protein
MHRFLIGCLLSAFLCTGGTAWAKDGKGHSPKLKATPARFANENEKRRDKIEKREDKAEKRDAKAFKKAGRRAVRARSIATTRTSPMRFRGLDRNHDGRITRNEWRGNDVSFRNHDWNRDGVLSGIEVRPGAKRPR